MSNHLKDNFVLSKVSDQQWLYHLPFGITEQDIKDYLIQKKSIAELDIEITQIVFEGLPAGFKIKVPMKYLTEMDTKNQTYWPPGWISKQYRNENQVYSDSKINCRNFSQDLAPTTVKITKNNGKLLSEKDFTEYAKEKVL